MEIEDQWGPGNTGDRRSTGTEREEMEEPHKRSILRRFFLRLIESGRDNPERVERVEVPRTWTKSVDTGPVHHVQRITLPVVRTTREVTEQILQPGTQRPCVWEERFVSRGFDRVGLSHVVGVSVTTHGRRKRFLLLLDSNWYWSPLKSTGEILEGEGGLRRKGILNRLKTTMVTTLRTTNKTGINRN